MMPRLIHKLRMWDYVAAQRVDHFIANSFNTAWRIAKYYWRTSKVIYPAIKIDDFPLEEEKDDYYFYIWRVIPYKKFDLLVDAFNENWKKLIVVTSTDNKLYRELRAKSADNIYWIFWATNETKMKLMAKAKAVLFPPEEDFWIVPLEAMACWTPVIAYWKWGALETVIEKLNPLDSSWIFFHEQTKESLNEAIVRFEKLRFSPRNIRKFAHNFDTSRFKEEIISFIEEKSRNHTFLKKI